ncbi:MAG TPA: HTH-type transcriptional activator IlvY [Oceanospirillaceae bacterium]|nr:HTH-type transcriptional activator IlvY [Oceanospirillaceae bacterium]
MDIRNLKQFIALAQHLHFGKASGACHVSLSALSRTIRQLETELGVALFTRDNRSVQITPQGQTFLDYARNAVSEWDAIRHLVRDANGQLQGEVSLYCSVTAVYSLLFDLFQRFRQDYPSIEIKLHTGDPDQGIARVISGEEDFAIAAHPKALPRELAFKPITVSPLVFIAAQEQPNLEHSLITPKTAQQWAAMPMVLPEGGLSRERIDAWFRAMDIAPTVYAQVAGNEAIVTMVSLGLGIGVVPKIVLDNSPTIERIQILDVAPQLEAYDVGLLVLKKNLKNPLVNALWKSQVSLAPKPQ